MWILQSSGSDSGGLTFRLRPGGIKTVGRAPRADFIVDAALVSRLHCRLEAGDDNLDVIDLSSTNGTYVNGKRVKRARLTSGDRLRVGRVELTVETPNVRSRRKSADLGETADLAELDSGVVRVLRLYAVTRNGFVRRS